MVYLISHLRRSINLYLCLPLVTIILLAPSTSFATNYNDIVPISNDNYLLVNKTEIEEAKRKAQKYAWAKTVVDRYIKEADQALKLGIDIPERYGANGLLFACKKDGFRLKSLSNNEHECPACKTVYKGKLYNENEHRPYSTAVRTLGLSYRFTDRKEYAEKAAQILMAYADRYTKYSRHGEDGENRLNGAPNGARLHMQTLGESRWLVPIVWGYSLIRETLNKEQQSHIEKGLLIPAAELLRAHHWGVHNKQSWMNCGFGLVGLVTGNIEMVKEAIEDKERGFKVLIEKGVTDEGFWYEGSEGYHNMTRQALVYLAEGARHAGIDLYSERFLKMYEAPIALSFPDGDIPDFNDGNRKGSLSEDESYEIAYARSRNPLFGRLLSKSERGSLEALLYGAEELPTGTYLPEESSILPSAGLAVLRSKEATVAIRFGLHGGWHGHYDKLGIITYGLGKYFGTDPGSGGYSNPMHDKWYRTTLSHNTVIMSMREQAGLNSCKIEKWEKSPESTTLVVSTDSAYSDATLKRTLRLQGNRLEDRFDCISDTRHNYDWVFHSPGNFSSSLKFIPHPPKLGSEHGYQFVENVGQAVTDGEWWVRWEQGNVRLTIYFKAFPLTEVFTGLGPSKDGSIPMLIVRRRGLGVFFDTTHVFEYVDKVTK
jgi:oligo-alginate lyase